MRRSIKSLVVLILSITSGLNAKAQLNINTSFTINEFVQNIVGPDATIVGTPSMKVEPGSCGLFINGATTNLGLSRGVLLTTGQASGVPYAADQFEGALNGYSPTLPLNALEQDAISQIDSYIPYGGGAHDISIIQFQVQYTCTELNVSYVFGSEEYREWVGNRYNDAFGFFISGGTYGTASTSINLAKVDGTNQEVTINTVNHQTNVKFYNDNETGQTIVYDGLTEVMNINAAVSPSTTYTITLVIADGSDEALSSGVFIQYGTFGCNVDNTCYIDGFTYEQTRCDAVNSKYNLKGKIMLNNPPTTGQLVIADENLNPSITSLVTQTFNAPFPAIINYNLPEVEYSGAADEHKLTATFINPPPTTSCDLEIRYINSTECPNNCVISNITTSAGTCETTGNTYNVTGVITYDYVGSKEIGELVITDGKIGKRYDIDYVLKNSVVTGLGDYEFSYTLEGLESDGATNKTIRAFFALIEDCEFESAAFTAPARCISVDIFSLVNQCQDCIASFAPEASKEYHISAWVSRDFGDISPPPTTFTDARVEVYFQLDNLSFTTPIQCNPSGQIIDGWQRISYTFTTPANATKVFVRLVNASTTDQAYFDDIRIHPNDGSMVSYVYDPISLKLVAELDDNNYATFYEYDKEGTLIRVKKETERGIVTIQEKRSSRTQK